MPESKTDRVEALHQVVEGLGCLIGSYPEGSKIARELENIRKHVLGLVFGEKAGTLNLDQGLSEEFGNIYGSLVSSRFKRAITRMEQDEKVVDRLADREYLRRLLE